MSEFASMLTLTLSMVRTMQAIVRLGKNPEPPQASYVGLSQKECVEVLAQTEYTAWIVGSRDIPPYGPSILIVRRR